MVLTRFELQALSVGTLTPRTEWEAKTGHAMQSLTTHKTFLKYVHQRLGTRWKNYLHQHLCLPRGLVKQKHTTAEAGRCHSKRSPISPPAQSRVNQSRFLKAMSSQVLSLYKEGDSSASLRTIYQFDFFYFFSPPSKTYIF